MHHKQGEKNTITVVQIKWSSHMSLERQQEEKTKNRFCFFFFCTLISLSLSERHTATKKSKEGNMWWIDSDRHHISGESQTNTKISLSTVDFYEFVSTISCRTYHHMLVDRCFPIIYVLFICVQWRSLNRLWKCTRIPNREQLNRFKQLYINSNAMI